MCQAHIKNELGDSIKSIMIVYLPTVADKAYNNASVKRAMPAKAWVQLPTFFYLPGAQAFREEALVLEEGRGERDPRN